MRVPRTKKHSGFQLTMHSRRKCQTPPFVAGAIHPQTVGNRITYSVFPYRRGPSCGAPAQKPVRRAAKRKTLYVFASCLELSKAAPSQSADWKRHDSWLTPGAVTFD